MTKQSRSDVELNWKFAGVGDWGVSEKDGKRWMGFGLDPGEGCAYQAKHVHQLEELKAAACFVLRVGVQCSCCVQSCAMQCALIGLFILTAPWFGLLWFGLVQLNRLWFSRNSLGRMRYKRRYQPTNTLISAVQYLSIESKNI